MIILFFRNARFSYYILMKPSFLLFMWEYLYLNNFLSLFFLSINKFLYFFNLITIGIISLTICLRILSVMVNWMWKVIFIINNCLLMYFKWWCYNKVEFVFNYSNWIYILFPIMRILLQIKGYCFMMLDLMFIFFMHSNFDVSHMK